VGSVTGSGRQADNWHGGDADVDETMPDDFCNSPASKMLMTLTEDKSLVACLACYSSMLQLVEASTSEVLATVHVVFEHNKQMIAAAATTGIEFESDERLRLSCQNGATIVIGLDKGEGGRFKLAFEYASPQREAPPSSPSSVPIDASEDADACVSPIEGTGMPVDAAMEEDSGMPPAAVEEAEETMRRGNRCEYCKQKKIHCGRRAGFKHLPCHIGSRNRFVFLSMRFSG